MGKVRFQILPPIDDTGEPVLVTGGHPLLGDWEPAKGLRLESDGPWLRAEIEVDEGTRLEFKFTRGTWQSEAVDAWGHVPPNGVHEVWLDSTVRSVIADWKDRYAGRLTRDRVASHILASHRDLVVWLPPSYGIEPEKRYRLVVMNDGDNVFDPLTSPFTGVDWAADEWVRCLARRGEMREAIVVAVRHPDGFYEGEITLRDADLSPELSGAAYSEFLVSELVPYIDTHYRTDAKCDSRVLAGADLGALNAFYTAVHHPGIFSRFCCLSTSFEDVFDQLPAQSGQLLALENEPALPGGTFMYFDYGTEGLDECYEPYHRELGQILHSKGWKEGEQFRIAQIPGGTHDEISWRQRFGNALRFVF
jgi:enterochelin esterase-like enzyme